MKTVKWRQWIAAGLAGMLIILAGCQSVGGFAVDRVLENNLKSTSSESSLSYSIELVVKEGTVLTGEEAEMVRLINSLKLSVDHMKVQDPNRLSVKGSIDYQDQSVPFLMTVNESDMLLWLEGARKPIAFSNAPTDEWGEDYALQYRQLQEQMRQAAPTVASYLVKHLPNPNVVSVTNVTEKVHGESLNLHKLYVEIKGDEMIGLVKKMLESIAKDEAGLKEIIGVLYDVYYPIMTQAMDLYGEAEDSESSLGAGLIKNKEAAVLMLYELIRESLDHALADFDKETAKWLEQEKELKQVLSKDTSLDIDLFVDNQMRIRKQNVAFTIAMPDAADVPFGKVIVRAESETWNINQPVQADTIDAKGGVLQFGMYASGSKLTANFEKDSTVYRILKDDLKVTQKQFYIAQNDELYYDWYDLTWSMLDGAAMVPIWAFADQLEADVTWVPQYKQVVVDDPITELSLRFTIGSDTVYVNGTAQTMSQPVTVDADGTAHAPLRFLAETLGAELKWDEEYKEFIVTRD